MLQIKRLAHATLTTPDIERQLEYYIEVLGLWGYRTEQKARCACDPYRLGSHCA